MQNLVEIRSLDFETKLPDWGRGTACTLCASYKEHRSRRKERLVR